MAVTDEMVAIALDHRPHAACLVPERREERTTEGGLDVAGRKPTVAEAVGRLVEVGIRASLFIEPDLAQISAASNTGAPGRAHDRGRAGCGRQPGSAGAHDPRLERRRHPRIAFHQSRSGST
jgi:pyridoxine 5-phosphate synthase